MTERGKIAAAVSAAALVASGLAGCGSGTPVGDPSAPGSATSPSPTTPPSSTTTSPSTTSTTPPSVPTVPLAARAHTKAGAEAFVRFYFDEVNKAWMQPSVRNLAAYGAPTCKSCVANIQEARRLQRLGRHYTSAPATIGKVQAVLDAATQRFRVATAATQEATSIVDTSGQVLEREPRLKLVVEAELLWRADRWLILAIRSKA